MAGGLSGAHQICGEGAIAIFAQEVIQAEAQFLKHHAHVAAVVEPLAQMHTVETPAGIVAL